MCVSKGIEQRDKSSCVDFTSYLPAHRGLFYGGQWHEPRGGYLETFNPATGESLGQAAEANEADVDAAVEAAHRAFATWRRVAPRERGAILKKIAQVLKDNAEELATLDALNCGNPIRELINDVQKGASQIEYFAGLALEVKGEILPTIPDLVNMTMREPYGVCARIVAYNHPLMFAAQRIGAPLVTGNTIILKPPPQAPLSAYRLMELLDGIVPPGVLNMVSGGRTCGAALAVHKKIPVVSLIGSVESGKACNSAAAPYLKKVILELGGKNAMIVYPDADIAKAIDGAVRGMNFSWCGQSCGSTSRLFLHESIHDAVVAGIIEKAKAYKPGNPVDPQTTMGTLISKAHSDRVLHYIELGVSEGATLALGGGRPSDPALAAGHFVEPTIFTNVDASMRIAREEIFGPVLSVLRWSDEAEMLEAVNAVDYGLTAAIYTKDLSTAHRAAAAVEAGYIWVNNSATHYLGAPFGGYKLSGIGREEYSGEIEAFTQLKNISITL
jgi:betaine-aldehyde dehydrogenase